MLQFPQAPQSLFLVRGVLFSFLLLTIFGTTSALATPVTIGFGGITGSGPINGTRSEAGFLYSVFSGVLWGDTASHSGSTAPEIQGGLATSGGILKIVSSTPNEVFNWVGFDLSAFNSQRNPRLQIIAEGFFNRASVGSEQFVPTIRNIPYDFFFPFSAAGPLAGTTIDELRITLPAVLRNPSSSSSFSRLDNVVLDKQIAQPPATVPEPGTIFLFGSGLAGLAAWRYRKNTIQA